MYGRNARKTTTAALPHRIPRESRSTRVFGSRPCAAAAHFFRYADQRVQAMKTTAAPVRNGR